MERTITINHPNQVESHPTDGTVTITEPNGERTTLVFAADAHAFDLSGAIADARKWRQEAIDRQHERDHGVDWFDVAKNIVGHTTGNCAGHDEQVTDLGAYTRAAIRDEYAPGRVS